LTARTSNFSADRGDDAVVPDSTHKPDHEPDHLADSLVGPAAEVARRWLSAGTSTRAERARAERLHRLTSDPASLSFALGFCDRVLRPESRRAAARQLRHLARGRGRGPSPAFLGRTDRLLLRAGAALSTVVPGAVLPLARRRLRALVGELIADATDPALARHLARLGGQGFRVNVNLLGESVLGHGEAARRRSAVLALMARPDVDYVSVKVSSVCAQINLWSYDETLRRTKDALREILLAATAATPPVFVNLDMEEYRDLSLTFHAFTELLDERELLGLEAGIVLQAYLPDSLSACGASPRGPWPAAGAAVPPSRCGS
jgi:RHH-type proline utilization regulon transcriptional repressor/proline dehydrogenase/delta 1-pyrroline-5-carboxylate dehydrogenase